MTALQEWHNEAVVAVEGWLLSTYPGSSRANEWRLRQHDFPIGTIGWLIPAGLSKTLVVAVDEAFPYTNPVTAVFGPNSPSIEPHVERNGRLCTFGTTARSDSRDPVGVVNAYITRALKLLSELEEGLHREDYIIDFNAYWRRGLEKPPNIKSLVEWRSESCDLFCWSDNSQLIVSDKLGRLSKWLKNFDNLKDEGAIFPGLYLWLDQLPNPAEYPETVVALRRMLHREGSEDGRRLDGLLSGDAPMWPVIFAGHSSPGELGRGGFLLRRKKAARGPSPIVKGFRPGKAPDHILQLSTTVTRTTITPLDGAITRRPVGQENRLRDCRISLIGCGSLGGGVATLLAQSGCEDIHIYDPDRLGFENIGRHELGAPDVGRNKAKAMAQRLRDRMPECNAVGFDTDWREAFHSDANAMSDRDLIISMTADWGSDCTLADLHAQGSINCPVIFGWMERHAMAAHALALADVASLRQGYDATGNSIRPVTSWWSAEHSAGCGGATSTYGAIELGAAQSLVARLSLEVILQAVAPPLWRVHVTATSQLEELGGFWSIEFLRAVGDPGTGARTFALKW